MEKGPKIVCIVNFRALGYERLNTVRNSFANFVSFEVLFAEELHLFLLSVTINSRDFFESFSMANKPKAQVFTSKGRLRSVKCLWQDWFVQILRSSKCFSKQSCLDFMFLDS